MILLTMALDGRTVGLPICVHPNIDALTHGCGFWWCSADSAGKFRWVHYVTHGRTKRTIFRWRRVSGQDLTATWKIARRNETAILSRPCISGIGSEEYRSHAPGTRIRQIISGDEPTAGGCIGGDEIYSSLSLLSGHWRIYIVEKQNEKRQRKS